jgi:hypothetical protein
MEVRMDNDFLSKQILKILNISFEFLSKSQRKNIADIIVALFFNTSFSLREIASRMPGDSNVKHKLKRLVYSLDTLTINRTFFKSYIKTLFALPNFRFRKRDYITILLDTTTLRDDFLILSASISYKGRAIPVYLKIWKGVNEPYDLKQRVRTFIKELAKLMPKHNYELIGDRGFQGHDMIEMFKGSRWEYVIRLSKNYCAKKKDSPKFVQLSLFEDGFYEDVTIGKNNPIENVNLSVNSIKNEEGERVVWYLLSSLKNQERVIKDYERRMWIEESFKDLKSTLNWEKYTKKVPQKGRLEKMIIISCLSYAIRLSLGEQVEIPPSEKNKTSVLKRFQHILSNSYRTIAKLFNTVVSLFKMNYQRSYTYFAKYFG